MPTETQITGGSCPMIISGREYQASPLTDLDSAELNEYVQFKIIDLAKNYIRKNVKNLSPLERKEIRQSAIDASIGLSWIDSEAGKVLYTVEGTARLAWQMLVDKKKPIFEEFLNIFKFDEDKITENMEEVDRVFTRLNIDSTYDPDAEGSEGSDDKIEEVNENSKN